MPEHIVMLRVGTAHGTFPKSVGFIAHAPLVKRKRFAEWDACSEILLGGNWRRFGVDVWGGFYPLWSDRTNQSEPAQNWTKKASQEKILQCSCSSAHRQQHLS